MIQFYFIFPQFFQTYIIPKDVLKRLNSKLS